MVKETKRITKTPIKISVDCLISSELQTKQKFQQKKSKPKGSGKSNVIAKEKGKGEIA